MPQFNKSNERELAFLFLYQMLNESAESLTQNIDSNFEEFWEGQNREDNEAASLDLSERAKFSTLQLVNSALSKRTDIEEALLSKLEKKSLDYIEKIERALLTLGAFEISFSEDKNSNRTQLINSYVDLAKKYGKKNSYGLVNGILDKV